MSILNKSGTGFTDKVAAITKAIPKGRVASYGQIAALITDVRATRIVGWSLHGLDKRRDIPWHRVLNSKGFISTTCIDHPANLQKTLLEKEGIKVIKKDKLWWVDLKKYLWKP